MRKIFTLVSAIIFTSIGYSQTYIDEDFSAVIDSITPPTSWKNIDSIQPPAGQIWRFDNPNPRTFNSPITDPAAILDSDLYGFNNAQDAYLSSPNFDASLATIVIIEFDHVYRHIFGGTAELEVFDGTNWVTDTIYTADTDPSLQDISTHEVLDISDHAAGVANAQVRFRYTGSFGWYWIIDNVKIFQPTPDDASVVSVDSTGTGCGFTATETITATVVNQGSTQFFNFPINYQVNGGTTVTETVMDTLDPGDSLQYTFTATYDFSALGSYNIDVFTSLRADQNQVNDTATGTNTQIASIATFPYTQGFENGNGGWISGGANNTWAIGAPAGSVINSAANGINSYVTNLTGSYNNQEESYVLSPCLDFSTLNAPQFKMNIWWNSESSWDGAVLQMSLDNGFSWQKVGDFLDPNNWYNDDDINGLNNLEPSRDGWAGRNSSNNGSGGWVLAEHDLTGAANQPSVYLRIAFGSDGSVTDEGVAIDDILIQEAPAADGGIVEIVRPFTNCALTANDTVEVRIMNAGSGPLTNFPVAYSINNGTPVVDTFPGTLNPGDSAYFVFDTTANLSATGDYTIVSYTSVTGDGNLLNDTLDSDFTNVPVISALPYNEGFETGNGGWVASGINSSWDQGIPTGSVINAAGGGLSAYVTNLTGNFNIGELSYITSPCFDLSSLPADPILRFQNTFTFNFDGQAWIEQSIDGGVTWTKIVDNGGAFEWYNDVQNQWWNATSSQGAGLWVNAENRLIGVAGQSAVRLRFVLSASPFFVSSEGFGVDNIQLDLPPMADAGVISIISPANSCDLGMADSVRVQLKNFGLNALTSIPISFDFNGGTPVVETITTNLAPGDTMEYTFTSATVNVAANGTYNLRSFTSVPMDGNLTNDEAISIVENTLKTAPYFENFDSFTSGQGFDNAGSILLEGWTSNPTGSPDFFWGARNNPTGSGGTGPDADNTGLGGNFIYVEGSNGPLGAIAELTSPCIDLGALTNVQLDFWYHKYGNDIRELYIDVYDGAVWVNNVDSVIGQTQTSNVDPYLLKSVNLTAFAGNVIQVRFRTDGKSGFATDMAIDDFAIFEPSATDAGVIAITAPASECGLGTADSVKIQVRNFGLAALTSVPVAFSFNGGTAVLDTIRTGIPVGDTVDFTFTTGTVNLSAPGTYTLDAYTSLSGDNNGINDSTLNYTVENTRKIAPYTEDFDAFTPGQGFNNQGSVLLGGWTSNPPSNPAYFWGARTGQTSSGNTGPDVDNTTGLGNYVFTEASNGASGDVAILTSPCIDASSLVAAKVDFYYHMLGAEINTLYVELENNNGVAIIDSIVGAQQTAVTDPFLLRSITITSYLGAGDISIRFRSQSLGCCAGDIAIDDFSLYEPSGTDAQVIGITSLTSGCGLGMDTIKVDLGNAGANTIDTIPLAYTINGSAPVLDTSFASIIAGGTSSFAFAVPGNFTASGQYTVEVYSSIANDGNRSNDTTSTQINSVPTVTFPYVEDFETSNGGWIASGTSSSWAWGAPSASVINTAGSGVNAWVTNITGNYNDNELSYLESPCIDLSMQTNDPVIRFLHTFETESCCDEGWVEVSVDGGLSWTKLVDNGTAQNWYNDLTDLWWDGTNNSGVGTWDTTMNVLTGTAGFSAVKVRFVFSSDGSATEEGFGIDKVEIDVVTSVNDIADASTFGFSIFPNPTAGEFTLVAPESNDAINIEVLDTKGQLVHTQVLTANSARRNSIDMSSNAKGIYFVRMSDSNTSTVKKLIVR